MKTKSEDYRGWWLILVMAGLQGGAFVIEHFWFTKVFDSSLYPRGMDPFYFIVRDFIGGICKAISLLLIFIIGLVNLKKYPSFARVIMLISTMFYGGVVGWSIIIFFKTSNLLTPELAESSWNTYEEYRHDPMIWVAHGLTLVLVVAMISLAVVRRKKSQPMPGTDLNTQNCLD